MLTSSFVFQPGIKINLPVASSIESNIKKELIVMIDKRGNLFFQDRRVSLRELGDLLQVESKGKREAILIISADKEALHGRVVQVMDRAKLSGIQHIAIAALPEKQP